MRVTPAHILIAGALLVPYTVAAVVLVGNVRFYQNLTVTGALSKGSGTFVIDHPLDPKNKLLYHSFVESPDVKNLYDGVAVLDAQGSASVVLPAYFETLNTDIRFQVSPIGAPMRNLIMRAGAEANTARIEGGVAGGRVSWQVTGTRKDPYILENPIIVEVDKSADTLVPAGELLHPIGPVTWWQKALSLLMPAP